MLEDVLGSVDEALVRLVCDTLRLGQRETASEARVETVITRSRTYEEARAAKVEARSRSRYKQLC